MTELNERRLKVLCNLAQQVAKSPVFIEYLGGTFKVTLPCTVHFGDGDIQVSGYGTTVEVAIEDCMRRMSGNVLSFCYYDAVAQTNIEKTVLFYLEEDANVRETDGS